MSGTRPEQRTLVSTLGKLAADMAAGGFGYAPLGERPGIVPLPADAAPSPLRFPLPAKAATLLFTPV